MFESYKTLTLLKFMKSIIRAPKLIKQIREIKHKKRYSLIERLGKLRDMSIKTSLMRLFLRQYQLKKQI